MFLSTANKPVNIYKCFQTAHINLLLIAILLCEPVRAGSEETYVRCTQICISDLKDCTEYFAGLKENIAACTATYFKCMKQCLKDHCPW